MFNFIHKLILLILVLTINIVNAHDDKISDISNYVNDEGEISFPSDFGISMAHLGSWYVPDGGASGFHDVYTEKESIVAFRQNGKFPDGATLVKELRASHAGDFTTGAGVKYSTSTIKQWFVMVKDSKNSYKNNPLWGDGWGWALFKPDDTSLNLVKNYKTDCLGCHIPVKQKDWIYTEGYPILNN